MNVNSCFKIAFVMKAHGLKGEVTLSLLPECPSLRGLQSVFLEIRGQLIPYLIESESGKGTRVHLKLEGVNSPEGAAALRGCGVYLPKSLRPAPSKGEFYNDEVTGFEVVDAAHGQLGTVQEVLETGGNRHLVVLRSGREVLIPVNGPFIKSVNRTKRLIRVELPDGLLEL